MSPFKNVRLYRLDQPWPATAGYLAEALASRPARTPGALEREAHGWQPPAGRGEPLVVSAGGCSVICLRTTERWLPPAVVAEELERQVAEIESIQNRKVGRKELRERVFTALLAVAPTRSRLTYAWIDPARGWLAVGAGSTSGAELLLGELRETVGALAVRPMAVLRNVSEVLTEWLHTVESYPFGIAEACTLDTELTLRAINFLEEVQEQRADVEAETPAERFAADAEIAIGTLTEMVEALVVALGGLTEEA